MTMNQRPPSITKFQTVPPGGVVKIPLGLDHAGEGYFQIDVFSQNSGNALQIQLFKGNSSIVAFGDTTDDDTPVTLVGVRLPPLDIRADLDGTLTNTTWSANGACVIRFAVGRWELES